MTRKVKGKPLAKVPAYDLKEVKRLVHAGRVKFLGNKVLITAAADFGWREPEIIRFYLALKPSHFYKREYAEKWDTDWLDVYKAEMFGCRVYTHFFINDQGDLVIINSFKADTSGERRS